MENITSAYISYILIGLSIIVSLIVWSHKGLMRYGFHREYYEHGQYGEFLKQLGLFQFIHGDILHLVMNSYFLYSAGPLMESILGRQNFLIFFLSTSIASAYVLYFFAPRSNTIGISGFCMALLSYLWITLYMIGDSGASEIGTLLIINIAFGFAPGISLAGHVAGALWGVIFYLVTQSHLL